MLDIQPVLLKFAFAWNPGANIPEDHPKDLLLTNILVAHFNLLPDLFLSPFSNSFSNESAIVYRGVLLCLVTCQSCSLCSALMNSFLIYVFHLAQVILSQEKHIHRLNELVRSLREQLQLCRHNNETTNGNESPLTEHVIELERQQILEN